MDNDKDDFHGIDLLQVRSMDKRYGWAHLDQTGMYLINRGIICFSSDTLEGAALAEKICCDDADMITYGELPGGILFKRR